MEEEKKETVIRLKSYGTDFHDGGYHADMTGMNQEEFEKFEATIAGCYWMRNNQGRLEFSPAMAKLPAPSEDGLLPFWRRTEPCKERNQLKLMDFEAFPDYSSPSFQIQHLCDCHYSDENYKTQAERLESYGFECLRSRRGGDGKYWEIWYLPGLWRAKGELQEHILQAKNNDKQRTKWAISFLCSHVQFGTLDVCIQRAAMMDPD